MICRCLLVSVPHRSCSPSRLEADAAAFDDAAEHDDTDDHDEPQLQHGGIQSAPALGADDAQPVQHTIPPGAAEDRRCLKRKQN